MYVGRHCASSCRHGRIARHARGYRVAVGEQPVRLITPERHHGLVQPAPVVLQFAFAPFLLELERTLLLQLRVVEIPVLTALRTDVAHVVHAAPCQHLRTLLGLGRLFSLLFLLSFYLLYDLFYDGHLLRLRKCGEVLQAVLQLHSIVVLRQFAECRAEFLDTLIVGVGRADELCGLLEARVRVHILLAPVVHITFRDEQHGLVYAVSRAELGSRGICVECLHGVTHGGVDVAHSVIYLVEILHVVGAFRHALQPLDGLGLVFCLCL